METGAAPHPAGGSHGKQGRGLHLRGQHAKALPRLPLLLQLIGHRHPSGGMLPIEGVLALYDPCLPGQAQVLRRLHQSAGHPEVGHSGPLDGCVLPAGPLHAHRAGGHHNIPALHVQVDAATGANADEGVRAQVGQLLHSDGGGGAADTGRDHADFLPQQGPGPGLILPVCLDMDGVVEILGDRPAPAGITGQDAVAAHIPLPALDMELNCTLFLVHRSALLSGTAEPMAPHFLLL